MSRKTVVNGKVMRTPSLGKYDNSRSSIPGKSQTDVRDPFEYNQQFVKDAPRTWVRDKARLVDLGVDGDVPIDQAFVNAGGHRAKIARWINIPHQVGRHMIFGLDLAENDNNEQAVNAA